VNKLFLVLLLVLPLAAHSEVSTQVRCFHSLEGRNINFEFRTYYDVAPNGAAQVSGTASRGKPLLWFITEPKSTS